MQDTELTGKSHLHIKSGFLKEFEINCQCQQQQQSNGICTDDCSQCFDYADVWINPRLNNQSDNVNKNRFHRAKRVNSTYPNGYYHTGIDILSGGIFRDLNSLLCGEVVSPLVKSFQSEQYQRNSTGNIITIKSKDKNGVDVWIQYCHLDSVSVNVGDKVKHGQKIGVSGCTGNAGKKTDGTRGIEVRYWHVHVEASRENKFYGSDKRIDPEQFMKTKFDESTQGNPITN